MSRSRGAAPPEARSAYLGPSVRRGRSVPRGLSERRGPPALLALSEPRIEVPRSGRCVPRTPARPSLRRSSRERVPPVRCVRSRSRPGSLSRSRALGLVPRPLDQASRPRGVRVAQPSLVRDGLSPRPASRSSRSASSRSRAASSRSRRSSSVRALACSCWAVGTTSAARLCTGLRPLSPLDGVAERAPRSCDRPPSRARRAPGTRGSGTGMPDGSRAPVRSPSVRNDASSSPLSDVTVGSIPARSISPSTVRRWCGRARVTTRPFAPARAVRPARWV